MKICEEVTVDNRYFYLSAIMPFIHYMLDFFQLAACWNPVSTQMMSPDSTPTFSHIKLEINFHCNILSQHNNSIQMSTNKPSIDLVVFQIASWALRNDFSNFNFSILNLRLACQIYTAKQESETSRASVCQTNLQIFRLKGS